MPRPRIPTPAQVRAVPVTSVSVMRAALEAIGLTVRYGGVHLKVTTAAGRYVGTVPLTPSDWRSLMNSRSLIARNITEITTTKRKAGR
jgi:hypothetical protein